MTTVGSIGALAVVVTTPGLSHVFGCTPVGPLASGRALLAAAADHGPASRLADPRTESRCCYLLFTFSKDHGHPVGASRSSSRGLVIGPVPLAERFSGELQDNPQT